MRPNMGYLKVLEKLAIHEIIQDGHMVTLIDKEDWDTIIPAIQHYALKNQEHEKKIMLGIVLTNHIYTAFKPDDPILRKKYK